MGSCSEGSDDDDVDADGKGNVADSMGSNCRAVLDQMIVFVWWLMACKNQVAFHS